jgi:integrase
VTWRDIEQKLGQGVSCPKLQSYWHFHGCRYDKISRTCAEPDHIQGCPLPSHDLRNGRLNQTAYSLFLFIRDACGGDLVGWIDARLAEAGSSEAPDRLDRMRAALIDPLREIYGVSDKVLAMALSCILLGAPKNRRLWIEAGTAMIAIDSLVHNSCTGPESSTGSRPTTPTAWPAIGLAAAPASFRPWPCKSMPDSSIRPIPGLSRGSGARKLSDVTGDTCREYVRWRKSPGGARRDLEDLRSAINHHAKEGLRRGVVRVVLPSRGVPRTRWLTRKEASALLRVCWRAREIQTQHRGKQKGQKIETDKRPLRHLAQFILIGLYTGTRASAIATASTHRGEGRSFVDLQNGIFYRLAEGRRATTKQQPPVPIHPRLLAHLRRWTAKGISRERFVEWNGRPVQSVKTAFKTAVRPAKLKGKISPHTLRHTAATWLMQAGVDKWEAAGFLGMSVQMLDRVYGHHHPDYLRSAARAIGYRPRQSLPISLPVARTASQDIPQPIEGIGGPGRASAIQQIQWLIVSHSCWPHH